MGMVPGVLWTIHGGETAKTCGKCETTWKNSWLPTDHHFNECPFCGAYFTASAKIRRDAPRKRRMHWKQVQSIKFLCRLGGDMQGIDWKLFKNDTYTLLLQKRTDLIYLFNKTLAELLSKLHKRK